MKSETIFSKIRFLKQGSYISTPIPKILPVSNNVHTEYLQEKKPHIIIQILTFINMFTLHYLQEKKEWQENLVNNTVSLNTNF